ncbi:hypothetical protein GUITHDRAFT_134169 [Guillardia theta CCMP2712]|uniref:LNS2/PITP domain-containing protein n=1 Tax=Guillardia theta (strain CCMP2712) TaxID=905079 RepID=L1JTU3_GUITC|nr:hypothetical protein GUITHDRAFT_134169 [Guillardia theta CCMP2712]EKX51822.1 hypothetical protein GUITHDRAFT_134169 [Guillardia theta CCMP2712]|eukprot:XP_005838802.1 hypothetical protein GUITHDRAFT_134169 [Guillardia theta CCMP2712]
MSSLADALRNGYVHEHVDQVLRVIGSLNVRLLYLTARPISLTMRTKTFLDHIGAPEGAVITMPHPVVRSLGTGHEDFKVSVLLQVRDAFLDASPFVAGFGNQTSDVQAYLAGGVPRSRIFIVDKTSKIRTPAGQHEFSSYLDLSECLPELFRDERERRKAAAATSARAEEGKQEESERVEGEEEAEGDSRESVGRERGGEGGRGEGESEGGKSEM